MVTSVDIVNMALSFLGEKASVSSLTPPEGSVHAELCARFYPIALRELLESYSWGFATKEVTINALRDKPTLYEIPSDCVHLVELLDSQGRLIRDYQMLFQEGTRVLKAIYSPALLVYVSDQVPASLFPSEFATCLSHLLASKIAGSVAPGSTGAEMGLNQRKLYEQLLQRAMKHDALQSNENIRVRGYFTGDLDYGDYYGNH